MEGGRLNRSTARTELGEKQQTPPQEQSTFLATHDFVVCAEVNGSVEIDGTAEIFCCMQSRRQIGVFDKAVMDGQVPEAFKDADQLEAICETDTWNREFHREGDHCSRQRADLRHV
jgi:hypothetical protein